MNFRVALQYEYTALGLDNCLERLGHHESDELAVQITAYVDNIVDVQELMEEAEAIKEAQRAAREVFEILKENSSRKAKQA